MKSIFFIHKTISCSLLCLFFFVSVNLKAQDQLKLWSLPPDFQLDFTSSSLQNYLNGNYPVTPQRFHNMMHKADGTPWFSIVDYNIIDESGNLIGDLSSLISTVNLHYLENASEVDIVPIPNTVDQFYIICPGFYFVLEMCQPLLLGPYQLNPFPNAVPSQQALHYANGIAVSDIFGSGSSSYHLLFLHDTEKLYIYKIEQSGITLLNQTTLNNQTLTNDLISEMECVTLFNGLLWESNSFGAILFANSMVECAQDLYLKDVAAGLGQQFIQWGSDFIPFDNQWINSLNLQIVSDASNQFFPSETEFVVRNLSPYIPTNLSAINLPSNICLISTPANITPDPIDCSLVQYSIPKDESREALLIARDSLNFQPGEEGLKWMSQEYLFHLLKMQPQLLLDYPELNAALATLESGAISDFNKLTDTLVIATDSTVQSVLADTLNVLDLDSLALAKAAEVKALNDALTVQQQIEENKRVMNDVYLSTSAIGMTDYSPAQLNNIRNIAAQCPATGGPSVYEARALLMLVDSTRADYSSSCTGLLRNAASESKYPVNFIGRIYPNPSTGVVNYEYRMEKNSAGTITINNVWGQELKRIPLTECLNTLTIDCGNFADGIYLYNIVVNNTTIARGKLSIIKE